MGSATYGLYSRCATPCLQERVASRYHAHIDGVAARSDSHNQQLIRLAHQVQAVRFPSHTPCGYPHGQLLRIGGEQEEPSPAPLPAGRGNFVLMTMPVRTPHPAHNRAVRQLQPNNGLTGLFSWRNAYRWKMFLINRPISGL